MTDAPDILETAQKALELSAKATAGPWESDDMPVDTGAYWTRVDVERGDEGALEVLCKTPEGACADAALIAFARNSIEALAQEVIRLRGEVHLAKRELKHWRDNHDNVARSKRRSAEIKQDMLDMWQDENDKLRDELTALREVERAARDMLAGAVHPRDCPGGLPEALAALDALRGGTGE
jgi:hypothetical protein